MLPVRDSTLPPSLDKYPGLGVNSLLDGNINNTHWGQLSNKLWELAGSFSLFAGKSRNKPGVLEPRWNGHESGWGTYGEEYMPCFDSPVCSWFRKIPRPAIFRDFAWGTGILCRSFVEFSGFWHQGNSWEKTRHNGFVGWFCSPRETGDWLQHSADFWRADFPCWHLEWFTGRETLWSPRI